jgi:hypothetical protein
VALAQAPNVNCTNTNPNAGGCLVNSAMHIFAFAGVPRTLSWSPAPSDLPRRAELTYQLQVLTWPAGVNVANLQTLNGVETATWTPPRAGIYYVRLRTCDGTVCGPWTDGRDDSSLPNASRGWMITAAVKPPTGGGIE